VNLASLLDQHPADRVALTHRGEPTTYGELRAAAGALRGELHTLGLEPGDRISIVASTNVQFVTAYFAVVGAGFIASPLNPRSPATELASEISSVEARAIIVGPAGAASVRELERSIIPSVEHILVPPGVELDGAQTIGEIGGPPIDVVEVADADVAALLFTSGTAGSPKAAMLTHGNLITNLDQIAANPGGSIQPDDVVLCAIPLFHILGLNAVLAVGLRAGARLVLVERFDPASVLEIVTEEKVTIISGPPTLWAALANLPDVDSSALAELRRGYSGAATLTRDVYDRVKETFGVSLIEGYGLTESGAALAIGADDTPVGSVGKPLPGVEIRLVDRHFDDVYIGDEGEVLAKGPNIFAGYWNDAEATNRAIDGDGWLHTGDLAVVDDDGWLRLVDRVKDLIVVSGFNVYPGEVEAILHRHPAVSAAAVIGVPHPHHGEAVRAYVVPEPGMQVEEDDLIAFCANQIAHYKCPVSISVVDEIPRTATGKVRRRDLRSSV